MVNAGRVGQEHQPSLAFDPSRLNSRTAKTREWTPMTVRVRRPLRHSRAGGNPESRGERLRKKLLCRDSEPRRAGPSRRSLDSRLRGNDVWATRAMMCQRLFLATHDGASRRSHLPSGTSTRGDALRCTGPARQAGPTVKRRENRGLTPNGTYFGISFGTFSSFVWDFCFMNLVDLGRQGCAWRG